MHRACKCHTTHSRSTCSLAPIVAYRAESDFCSSSFSWCCNSGACARGPSKGNGALTRCAPAAAARPSGRAVTGGGSDARRATVAAAAAAAAAETAAASKAGAAPASDEALRLSIQSMSAETVELKLTVEPEAAATAVDPAADRAAGRAEAEEDAAAEKALASKKQNP